VLAIRFTPESRAAFRAIAISHPVAWVELDAMFGIVSAAGLAGERLIANVNGEVDVYLLDPASPAPSILAVYDSRQERELLVVDFPVVSSLSPNIKKAFASQAATAAGIICFTIDVF
jgi:hypothetical protein